MKSGQLGLDTSQVEVTNISKHGLGRCRPEGPAEYSPGRQPWVGSPFPLTPSLSPTGEGARKGGEGAFPQGLRPGLPYYAPSGLSKELWRNIDNFLSIFSH